MVAVALAVYVAFMFRLRAGGGKKQKRVKAMPTRAKEKIASLVGLAEEIGKLKKENEEEKNENIP